jgi:hypothetical protein
MGCPSCFCQGAARSAPPGARRTCAPQHASSRIKTRVARCFDARLQTGRQYRSSTCVMQGLCHSLIPYAGFRAANLKIL